MLLRLSIWVNIIELSFVLLAGIFMQSYHKNLFFVSLHTHHIGSMYHNRMTITTMTAFASFVGINILFLFKYIIRYSNSPLLFIIAALAYVLFSLVVVSRGGRMVNRKSLIVLLAVYTVGWIIAGQHIPLNLFSCDRWKIITIFSQALEGGSYPYAATSPSSGNMPGASPVYFLLGYPFYRLGIFECMPLLVPWLWLLCVPDLDRHDSVMTTLLLITSPCLNYEILTRSTILFNSVLVFIWCAYFLHFRRWSMAMVIGNAVAGGLLLNTRSVFIIPFLVLWFSSLQTYRGEATRLVIWGVIGFLTFISMYIIMGLIWGMNTVITTNPFTVQTENLYPLWFTVCLMVLSVTIGICNRHIDRALLWSGRMLLFAAVTYIVLCACSYGVYEAIFGSMADITYLLFCYPFILYYITFHPTTRLMCIVR